MRESMKWALGLAVLGASLAAWAQADDARAKKIVGGSCFICHGAQGELSTSEVPRLAGQPAATLSRHLQDFKSGQRPSSTMAAMVANLSPQDMRALGLFFEKQVVAPEPAQDGQ